MTNELILFDADDTLFDFAASQEVSFRKTLEHFHIQDRFQEIFPTYVQISQELWRRLERNEISKDFLKVHRFQKTFEIYGLDLDAQLASQTYLELLPENVHLVPDAFEVCEHLSRSSRLGIVTNGVASIQKRRLEKTKLKDLIELMVISDECGYAKPDQRIFEHTLKIARHDRKETVLMVGDRLEADILGAHRAGLRSCWFNPHQIANETDIRPHREIHSLRDLQNL